MYIYAHILSEVVLFCYRSNLENNRFSRIRCIVEAAKVDLPALRTIMGNMRNVTFENLIAPSKDICNRHLVDLRRLHAEDKVLRPREHY